MAGGAVGPPSSASPGAGSRDEFSYYPVIQPDDFWKHLREWDFCTYYYQSVNADCSGGGSRGNNDGAAADAADSATSTLKPLPDTFLNHRHYAAAWAPLILAECRAQLLQEWTTTGRSSEPGVLVNVESTHSRVRAHHHQQHPLGSMDDADPGGHVILTVPRHAKPPSGPGSGPFMNGDVCLLVQPKHAHVVADLSKGSKSSIPTLPGRDVGDYSGISLTAHTESSRSNLQGLVLKVSKRKWARAGQKEMVVFRIGSNVTALREFTALARVETLPMKRYVFGQHLRGDGPNRVRKLSRHQSADALIQRMGGTAALGEGFIQYAKDKFNPSQLTAIAASANEYGDGGFTLIKGPPGTGSKWGCSCVMCPFPKLPPHSSVVCPDYPFALYDDLAIEISPRNHDAGCGT
jgi:senataxin